ncbi:MAG: LysR family transcriptional regulator [Bdellovibrionaceae bacterium]|nr:LysR family transcriptional regulator [Pseudobdellovibrionaceae bacterium]NUM58585.1 LysR family transcriptional regulator [Pseudobdellovibrionaceae bacterium]
MMNLYQLTTFVTVISEGSMTAAADKLFLTQPAVSQQIRNLEEELGVELLVRGVRQIKATPQGEILYEHARKILNHVQQAEIAIKSMGAELKGNVVIGTLNSLGLHMMSPIIGRLLRHNPDLMVKVEYNKGEELLTQFNNGLVDVVILPEVTKEFKITMGDGVESKFLNKEEMWLVSSGKDSNIPQQISISELCEYPIVHFTGEYPAFDNILNQKIKSSGKKLNVIFESSNVGTLKRVVETGIGLGFLPAHSVKKQVRSGRMNRIHVKDLSYEMDLVYYYKRNSQSKVLVETFYQALSQQEKG